MLLKCSVNSSHKRHHYLHVFLFHFASKISTLSRVTLSREGHIHCRDRERSRYRISIMFPEPTTPGINTDIPTHIGQVSNSHTTSADSATSFAYVFIFSLMPSRWSAVQPSESESTFCFNLLSQTLSDTIREPDRLRHGLDETRIRLRSLEQEAASFDIQKGAFIEQTKSLQSELGL